MNIFTEFFVSEMQEKIRGFPKVDYIYTNKRIVINLTSENEIPLIN